MTRPASPVPGRWTNPVRAPPPPFAPWVSHAAPLLEPKLAPPAAALAPAETPKPAPVRFRRGCGRRGPFAQRPEPAGFAPLPAAASSITPGTSPTLTSSPSCARCPAQHAGLRSADLEIDLVGLELHERVTGGDHVSFVSQPFRDPGVDDGLSDLRHDDIRSHVLVCPCLTGRCAAAASACHRI